MRNLYYSFIAGILFLNAGNIQSQWKTGQEAAFVIGQSDFTSSASATTAKNLNKPWGLAVDDKNKKLYVADWGNHRVLRFSLPISKNQPDAELVLGQIDFVTGTSNKGGNPSAGSLAYPKGIAVYNDTLWVCDYSNQRVLRFDKASTITTNGADANSVLGQTSFTANNDNPNDYGVKPNSVFFDGSGNLYVVDGDNRVVRFNNASQKANGATADGVLGQPDFNSTASGLTASKMSKPTDGVFVGSTMYVADYGNHRILKFNNAATKANGADADGVLGAADFTSAWSGTDIPWLLENCAQATGYPYGLEATPEGSLLVNQNLPRVSIFNEVNSKANFSKAELVLGQDSFNVLDKATSQKRLTGDVREIAYANSCNQLFVIDFSANRILVFAGEIAKTLDITKTQIEVLAANNSTATFDINSNTDWSIKSSENWIVADKTTGNGNATITLTAQENTTNVTRSATITISAEGIDSKTISVNQEAGTTTEIHSKEIKLRIYPNPVMSEIYIENFEQSKEISIYNADGKLILKTVTTGIIPVNHLKNGFYYLKIQNDEQVLNAKFLKM